MTAAAINFSCPQCQKKFSTPAAFAGKALKCSCGNSVTVPSPQSATASMPVAAPAYTSAATNYPSAPQAASQAPNAGFTSVSSHSSPQQTGRRDFPALRYVARCIDVISWIYVVLGMIGALGFVAAAGADAFPFSILGGILIGLVVLLVAVFIRASAEMIRLALYVAELLEDIRENTA